MGSAPQGGSLASCFLGSIRRARFVLLRINAKQVKMELRHGRQDGDEADAAKPN